MATLEFQGKSYEVDEEGYLLDPEQWNKELADHMAKTDGLDLTQFSQRVLPEVSDSTNDQDTYQRTW
jgi:tRNA 2-thiouridine synthesizing protein E